MYPRSRGLQQAGRTRQQLTRSSAEQVLLPRMATLPTRAWSATTPIVIEPPDASGALLRAAMFDHLDRLVQTSPDGALASVPSTPSPRVVANRLTDRRCSDGWRHRRSPVALESSNCSNVPPVRIQQAPCSPAPARMAYNGLGRLGEPARRTAGALAQAAALHVAARTLAKYPI